MGVVIARDQGDLGRRSAWVMAFCDVNFHVRRVVLCSTGERAWMLMFPEDQRDDEFEKTLHHARGHVPAGRQLYR